MRYQLSSFRQNFFDLMHCTPDHSMANHVFKTTIDNTEIVAKANHLDHITSINIKTQLSTGLFASDTIKKKQLETHVKSYVMSIGSLINMDSFEIQMVIENMVRTIPYSGKGIKSEQHQIKDGWEVTIRIPISDFETRLHEYNNSVSKIKRIPQVETFEAMFSAESFIYNLNRNLQVLEPNGIKITEVNLGEIERAPILFAQFSNDTIIFLQLDSDYKHLNSVNMIKMKDESITSFTHKETAALLCFIPDQVNAATIFLKNFLNDEIELPIMRKGITKNISILQHHDPEKYIFEIHGRI